MTSLPQVTLYSGQPWQCNGVIFHMVFHPIVDLAACLPHRNEVSMSHMAYQYGKVGVSGIWFEASCAHKCTLC